ncbi:MAG: putative cysteine proteinase, partial [Streblomastix strix]
VPELLIPEKIFGCKRSEHDLFKTTTNSYGDKTKETNDWNNIQQGRVSDCAFITALILNKRAESEDKKIPFITDKCQYFRYGRFQVRFFVNGAWRVVQVDDSIPCYPLGKGISPERKPRRICVARSKTPQELWVTLYEKAYLRLVGDGYNSEKISFCDAMFAIGKWIPDNSWKFDHIIDLKNDQWKRFERLLLKGDIAAKISVPIGQLDEEASKELGIIENHAYAIVGTAESKTGTVRLLQLRNPHGEEVWRGSYSGWDTTNWVEELKEAAMFSPEATEQEYMEKQGKDGTFWISLDDVSTHFENLQVCLKHTLYPHEQRIHFSWQKKDILIKNNKVRTLRAPQILLKKKSTTQTIFLILEQHYQSSEPINKIRNLADNDLSDLEKVLEADDDEDQNELNGEFSIAMHIYKHGRQISDPVASIESEKPQMRIFGETNVEPLNPRVLVTSQESNTTTFRKQHIIVERFGNYELPQDDEFGRNNFCGYFTVIPDILDHEIKQKKRKKGKKEEQNQPLDLPDEIRFTLHVFSNESLECCRQIPVEIADGMTIKARWGAKPLMKFKMKQEETVRLMIPTREKELSVKLWRREALVFDSKGVSQGTNELKAYFDLNKYFTEAFQSAMHIIFSQQFVVTLQQKIGSQDLGSTLIVTGQWEQDEKDKEKENENLNEKDKKKKEKLKNKKSKDKNQTLYAWVASEELEGINKFVGGVPPRILKISNEYNKKVSDGIAKEIELNKDSKDKADEEDEEDNELMDDQDIGYTMDMRGGNDNSDTLTVNENEGDNFQEDDNQLFEGSKSQPTKQFLLVPFLQPDCWKTRAPYRLQITPPSGFEVAKVKEIAAPWDHMSHEISWIDEFHEKEGHFENLLGTLSTRKAYLIHIPRASDIRFLFVYMQKATDARTISQQYSLRYLGRRPDSDEAELHNSIAKLLIGEISREAAHNKPNQGYNQNNQNDGNDAYKGFTQMETIKLKTRENEEDFQNEKPHDAKEKTDPKEDSQTEEERSQRAGIENI